MMTMSNLARGNAALRDKDFNSALQHYRAAESAQPGLAHLARANIQLALRRLNAASAPRAAGSSRDIDVVVPVFNALEDVQRCLQSLERHTDGLEVKVIVVNDGSDEATTAWLRSHCKDKALFSLIEHPGNRGYTRAVNTGLKASTAAYVITQNSDTVVAAGWLLGLLRCMDSAPRVGIVGPLSNAASWQNVPHLRDDAGLFAVNSLPDGMSVDDMARLVARASARSYPRLPFANGFCFMIKRAVLDAVGYMDEENFPVGYGEENDFCFRAMDAGYELAIADDVFVFHAKSKSFGHERRKELSEQGTRNLKRKHTPEKYQAQVDRVKKTDSLDAVRARIHAALESQSQGAAAIGLMSMRILFLLPVKGGGGGAHSVVQEVNEMRRLGLHARVGVKTEQVAGFVQNYADIANAAELFVGFDNDSLLELAEDYDVVIGTIFSSMSLVKRIVDAHPHILPAYYVQDYEPMFFDEGSAQWTEAFDSFTLVPGAFMFAKTRWIIDEVKKRHGGTVHKVRPSIDHEVYKPSKRPMDQRIHVAAMIRPQTPRRGAGRTMRIASRLHKVFGEQVVFHLFGCAEDKPEFQELQRDFPYVNHGSLTRPKVADLLGRSDIFLDLSDYQAFGRTGLEAMACGCASVVPRCGGTDEYAEHGVNSLIVDTLDEDHCFEVIQELLHAQAKLEELQRAGLETASRYSVHAAAVSECLPLGRALSLHRQEHPRRVKPTLLLLPSRREDGLPAESGYVRVTIPYRSTPVSNICRVKHVQELPPPGSAQAILIQRDAGPHSLGELKRWHADWRTGGGRLIYEIDDDLLDLEGLKKRAPTQDPLEAAEKVRFLAANADMVFASTPPLAQKLVTINPRVRVIPQALNGDLWQVHLERDHAAGPFARSKGGPIRIGYIGTPTDDDELDLITPAMRVLQKKYGERIEIEVIGGFQHRKPTFGKKVGLPKKNDYPNFVGWLLQRVHWDIGLLPLTSDSFSNSKSHLKFLEYAALDMAIAVADVEPYRPVARDNGNCLVTKPTTEDWVAKVSMLIEDSELRQRLARAAREECLRNHTTQVGAPLLAAQLNEVLGVAHL